MSDDYARMVDARMEEWDIDHPADMRCDECGHGWWGNWTRPTRVQPAEPRIPDCPRCEAD